jgi:hypothetical protein
MKNLIAVLMSMFLIISTSQSQMAYQTETNDDLYDLMTFDASYEADYLFSEQDFDTEVIDEASISIDILGYVVEDLNFEIDINHESTLEIKLYDADGLQIKTLKSRFSCDEGQQVFSSNIEKLSTGRYLLVVNTPDLTMAHRFNKI